MAETSRVSKNEASPETFRSCAGAAVQLCGARLQRIWVLGGLLHPDVHGRACLIQEVSWLASAPWKPEKKPLFLLPCGRRHNAQELQELACSRRGS